MRQRERIVVDTNCLISSLLLAESVPGRAVFQAVDSGLLLVSEATLFELAAVLAREKFDRYVTVEDRQQFLRVLSRVSEMIHISNPVRECRDPNDDKILEVALNGRAHLIVSGDTDLLKLHPWRGIDILSPQQYLSRHG